MAPLASLVNYTRALERHAAAVCSPGTVVTFNGISEERYHGRMPADVLRYPYAKHVLQAEAIEFARAAERRGYDAVVLGSFSEPFLVEIRSLLDIPVVSLAESSLLVACSLADQFALITLAPSNVQRLRKLVRRHGLEARISALYPLSNPVDENDLNTALAMPETVINDFCTVSRRAVQEGADLIVPAEGVLNEIMFANGTHTIDNATVLDCVGTTLLYAELLVALKVRAHVGVSRRSFAQPPPDLLHELSER
jgi:allantoin racemase